MGTFAQYRLNIIVGPLGLASAITNTTTGVTNVSQHGNGIAIYKGSNAAPSIKLTKRAIEKILNR